MKKLLLWFSLFLMLFQLFFSIKETYTYNRDYGKDWALAVKASTIPQKMIYVDKFVASLEASNLHGHSSFLPTDNNDFDKNLEQLKTLQLRLRETKGMDITSFAYQTLVQQVTSQEMDEAGPMLAVFEGVYKRTYYPFLWSIYGTVLFLLYIFPVSVYIIKAVIKSAKEN